MGGSLLRRLHNCHREGATALCDLGRSFSAYGPFRTPTTGCRGRGGWGEHFRRLNRDERRQGLIPMVSGVFLGGQRSPEQTPLCWNFE